ncbi:MerR family transcriptional regulator [Streptomyces collinus]|uniref:MerR family transcriptional regulator n=1 Tax=Streptomyces collinus TaxID=42684 RepID=UPI0038276BE8
MPQNLTVINGEGETLSVPAPAAIPETLGYRGPTACAAVGISYRQLDYWARTGLVEPSARSASGRGSERLYSFRDVVLLRIIKRFLDTGVSLQIMRDAVQRLRTRRFAELAGLTLMFDGTTIYECSTPDEVHGLLQGGQGIFGVAVGVVVQDVTKTLAMLTGERVEHEGSLAAQSDMDELARRRHRAG